MKHVKAFALKFISNLVLLYIIPGLFFDMAFRNVFLEPQTKKKNKQNQKRLPASIGMALFLSLQYTAHNCPSQVDSVHERCLSP
jgi:hypothetical protein